MEKNQALIILTELIKAGSIQLPEATGKATTDACAARGTDAAAYITALYQGLQKTFAS
ncbi:MAG: hypothetical protein V4801_02530 [Burkholderia gladioli]